MIPELDRRSVASGAIVGVAVGAVAVVAIRLVVHDSSTRTNVSLAFVIAGWVAAGWVAARDRADTPLTHGMAAGVASFVVLAVVDALVALARGHGVPGALVLAGILSAVAGMAGGWLSLHRPPT